MTATLSDTVRNAILDAIESTIGTLAVLKIRTGTPPATVATGSTGTVLATMTLPSDWMGAASGGTKALLGTWQDTSADASGRPGHFEITASNGTTVHMRGVAAGPWKPSTAYAIGDTVTNDTLKVYRATAAGTSAGSGGPTGTGASIVDSGVTWTYLQAAAELVLDASDFTAGQTVTIPTFGLTAPNA